MSQQRFGDWFEIEEPYRPPKRAKRVDDSELEEAAAFGDVCTLESILNNTDRRIDLSFHGSGRTMLQWASEAGHGAVVELLLDKGARMDYEAVETSSPVALAFKQGHMHVVKILMERGPAQTGPQLAIHLVKTEETFQLRRLLETYPHLVNAADTFGRTPLHHATLRRSFEVVDRLISLGAEPGLLDVDRFAPIHYSIQGKDLKTFKRLLEEMHDIELVGAVKTPLAYALDDWARGNEFVSLLLERGASTRDLPASKFIRFFRYEWKPYMRLVRYGHGPVQIETRMESCNTSEISLILSQESTEMLRTPHTGQKKQIW